jgi:tetratricopeptide (TPR) repeat protein
VLLLASVGSPAMAASANLPPPTLDPYFREALFHYFRHDPQSAVSVLEVAQQAGRLRPSAETQLLLGSALLSAGMHKQAARHLDALVKQPGSQGAQNQAWYFIGRLRYQRGQYPAALAALGRIRDRLPGELEADRQLLLAQVYLQHGEYRRAATHLRQIPDLSPVARYAKFNLGVALIKAGDYQAGVALLDELGRTVADGEELLSLRDKANVALGYLALQRGDAGLAGKYLERVRLRGMLANKALLGFGWSKALCNRHEEALVPWQKLAARDLSDSAVLEAWLAIPYSYNALGARRQALRRYDDAIAAFQAESVRLEQSIAQVRTGKLIEPLFQQEPGRDAGDLQQPLRLPDGVSNHHLALLLAGNDIQETLKSYRHIQSINASLQEWGRRLPVFREAISRHRENHRPLPPAANARYLDNLRRQQRRHHQLKLELDRIERESDVFALASPGERAQIARLARVRQALERPGNSAGLAPARERFRRVQGALRWNLTTEFPTRLLEARKSLHILEQRIVESGRTHQALVDIRHEAPRSLDRLDARMESLQNRRTTLEVRALALTHRLRQHVEELAVAELEHQKDRLAGNVGQAYLSIARIYDSTPQEPDAQPSRK